MHTTIYLTLPKKKKYHVSQNVCQQYKPQTYPNPLETRYSYGVLYSFSVSVGSEEGPDTLLLGLF